MPSPVSSIPLPCRRRAAPLAGICLVLLLATPRQGMAAEGKAETRATVTSQLPAALPRSIADVMTMLAAFPADAGALDAARERLAQPPVAADGDRDERLRDLLERAAAAARSGDQAQRLAAAREAARLAEGSGLAYRAFNEWANAEEYAGNLGEGIRIRELSRSRYARGSGRIGDNAVLADSYAALGDLASGKRLLQDSEAIYRQLSYSSQWQDNHDALIERQRGDAAYREGRYEEAESAYLKAFTAADRDIAQNRRRLAAGMNTPSQDVVVSMRDLRGVKLARTLLARSRTGEAEWYARDLIRIALEYSGPSHPSAARAVGLLAEILLAQGRFVEAEALARTRLLLLERTGIREPSGQLAGARGQIASALLAQERWAEALAEFERRQQSASSDATLLRLLENDSLDFAIALLRAGQSDRAESLLDARHRWWRDQHGAAHPQAATALAFAALARGAKGQRARALADLAEAFPVLEEQSRHEPEDDPGGVLRARRLRWIAEGYLALLAASVAADPNAVDTAFRVADAARRSSVQQALAATAARAAVRDPRLADLARREQDAGQRSAARAAVLAGVLARPPEQQLPKIVAELRRDIDALGKQRLDLRQQIERDFPDYSELIAPRPVSIAQARGALDAGETLLAIYAGERESYVWAFAREGPVAFVRTAPGRDELARQVAHLRRALDPGGMTDAADIPDFDLAAAHRLYASLLAPVAAAWQGSAHLLVAAGGALGQLPLGLLPVSAPAASPRPRAADYRQASWLIRQIAVTEIPSISALVGLRRMPPAAAGRRPFIGFGDPQFDLAPAAAAATASRRRLRNLAIERPPPPRAETLAGAAGPPPALAYERIPPLPDTRDEILALAGALGADIGTDVFLGPDASTNKLLGLDLSQRRIVAFATHGLLPGDFPGVAEPALALANPGDGRHGLLTLSDVLGLRLDADWVVLSACNTAAGDGAGADAISGLGRGFFYAGSRALLVTHWPVESASARLLVSGIFSRYAAEPSLSRAEALRQAMLAVMATEGEEFSYAHPLFWAPYAVVGDGGRRR